MQRIQQAIRAREIALQILFAWDANGAADEPIAQRIAVDAEPGQTQVQLRAIDIATGAWEYRAETESIADRLAPQWPTRRQPAVDRNILRIGIWEMHHTQTPPKVVIDEAIELAKSFSTENSPGFINAILDEVRKEREKLTQA